MLGKKWEEDSENKYIHRLQSRIDAESDMSDKLGAIMEVARSSESHFGRFALSVQRLKRAEKQKDLFWVAAERLIMEILLYESIDTIFIVLALLDFDKFHLKASLDGYGVSGESASEILSILNILENQASEILAFEQEFSLQLDFLRAVDEKEGITFLGHKHWQDFVPGSFDQSFFRYFKTARRVLDNRLHKKPRIWTNQTVAQFMKRRGYPDIFKIYQKLERMVEPAAIKDRIA